MKKKGIILAVILLLSVYAQAEDQQSPKEQLITPTLWVQAPDMFACNLTNVDQKTHTVQVRIITNGKILLESKKLSLKPKHTADHYAEGLPKGAPIYCEFTVEGPKEMYRGVAKIFPTSANKDFTGSDTVAISAQ